MGKGTSLSTCFLSLTVILLSSSTFYHMDSTKVADALRALTKEEKRMEQMRAATLTEELQIAKRICGHDIYDRKLVAT